ncbi:MAG TPA: hypothetical protein VJ843_04980 [Candidatus Saccharimonadales bacterium]|nr:hypothetical protein [Candidatus Saccharimonadales bacterium]
MDKKYWHHFWNHYIKPVKIWYLLVATLILVLISGFALRHNNQTMGKLREAVYTADQNNGDVVAALQKLQSYVTSHMNTNLATNTSVYPPIQLKYTYQRLKDAADAQAAAANSDLYTTAQKECEAQNPTDFSGRNRVPCIEAYVTAHGGVKAATIPDSMYKFNFASPTWSPDFAGWSLVLAAFAGLLLLIRVLLAFIFPRVTK